MPYWIEQRTGPHVARIRKIVNDWRKECLTDREAWLELAELYKAINDRYPSGEKGRDVPPDQSYALHRDGYGADVEYMLTTWFPRYANSWYAGWKEGCEAKARELELRYPGARFEVCYEY